MIEGRRNPGEAAELKGGRDVELHGWKRRALVRRGIRECVLASVTPRAVGAGDHPVVVRVVDRRDAANVVRAERKSGLEDLRVVEASGELRDRNTVRVDTKLLEAISRPCAVHHQVELEPLPID